MSSWRNFIFKFLCLFGIGRLLLFYNRSKNRIPVLVFHKIIPEYDATWPGIHPDLFEKILIRLKKHYTIRPISDLLTKKPEELKDACFITFDDGYKDYLDYAYPILKRHQVPSALFVLPYQISNKGHIWTSTINFFIKHYPYNDIEVFFKNHGVQIDNYQYDYFKLNHSITRKLCKLQAKDRVIIINALRQKFIDDNRVIENELLTFNELRSLNPNLTQVESHSFSHPSFKVETDENFITMELKESKEVIEKELNKQVTAFAFPFAEHNELSFIKVKQLYKMCFTDINNFVYLDKLKNNPEMLFDLSRFYIHQNSAEEVFMLINGFHRIFKR